LRIRGMGAVLHDSRALLLPEAMQIHNALTIGG
jgi:hypothetical protein